MLETNLTASELSERLKNCSPSDRAQLAARIRSEVGDAALAKGAQLWVSELTVAWAIAGLSSDGICAFTAAWQRPDQFGADDSLAMFGPPVRIVPVKG